MGVVTGQSEASERPDGLYGILGEIKTNETDFNYELLVNHNWWGRYRRELLLIVF